MILSPFVFIRVSAKESLYSGEQKLFMFGQLAEESFNC